jgi:hypothetical protein
MHSTATEAAAAIDKHLNEMAGKRLIPERLQSAKQMNRARQGPTGGTKKLFPAAARRNPATVL